VDAVKIEKTMSQSCLWLIEEYNRQAAELNPSQPESSTGVTITPPFPPNFTFLTISMPNGDQYAFDLCLTHGEIRALGKLDKVSNGRDGEDRDAANPD